MGYWYESAIKMTMPDTTNTALMAMRPKRIFSKIVMGHIALSFLYPISL